MKRGNAEIYVSKVTGHAVFLIALTVLFVFLASPAAGEDQVMVRTSVESNDVYVGETFLMQITVIGSTDADVPDLGSLEGFAVEYGGASNNSSQSVSIINGKYSRTVKKEYVFSFRLTPERSGTLEIPSVPVNVGGKTLKTNSLAIRVRDPQETDDFKLRLRLSRDQCYVGEPILLRVSWYLRKNVNTFRFTAPFLETDDFMIEVPHVELEKDKQYFRVPIGQLEFIAEKGTGTLEGDRYTKLDFSVALIPRREGIFTIPEFIVACETGGGLTRDSFFDDFFSRRQGSRDRRRKYVVPSNTPTLRVRELPAEGRPAGFAGLVGEYRISTSASPLEVNVGDPITLTVTLEGSDYMQNVELPPLERMEGFSKDFKIPEERAAGKVEGKKKIFTQTVRAKSENVDEIPPVVIVSFDTASERYVTVRSDPIPLKVNPTRIVTASDAEGLEADPERTALEQWKDGIAYNYEGRDLLTRSAYGFESQISRWWNILLLALPTSIFIILLAGSVTVRNRRSDPLSGKAREARKALRRRLSAIEKGVGTDECGNYGEMLEAFREFLGAKLRRAGSALTAEDIDALLRERDIEGELIESAKRLMEACEAGTYAGSVSYSGKAGAVMEELEEIAKRLDKKL